MGQVLHGCARTTAAVRRTIQHSQKSLNALAEQYGINPKPVAKWKKRAFANDAPMGPKEVRSTVLTQEEEAAIVAFRKYTAAAGRLPVRLAAQHPASNAIFPASLPATAWHQPVAGG